MEERQVTTDGHTYRLDEPFMVIATQNPLEMEGTYPLPEAQRDRFMARVSMGYPVEAAELKMLESHGETDPLAALGAVTDSAQVAKLVDVVKHVFVSPAVRRYAVALITATRQSPDLRLGASPRATLHLMRAAKAAAALDLREYVIPDDLQRLAPAVLGHRLLLSADAAIGGRRPEGVLASIIAAMPVPQIGQRSSGSRRQA
jgi:MoxR-like ATPase